MESVFDQFTQADATTTRHIGGSGLGLTISKRLVELHNGNIYVYSDIGHGTNFYFTIPAIRENI